jgi:LmbE family N-acetylglucosaminyl deacetylase
VKEETRDVMAPGLKQDFMTRLAGDDTIPGDRIAVIVAHADDETLGLGAQLPRLPHVTIVHVTDGAPRNLFDAHRKGFSTAEEYAAVRQRELEEAVARAGVPRTSLMSLGVADQDAAYQIVPLVLRIASLIEERGFEVVFTHAYEGGHPDHDATAFAVDAAVRVLAARDPAKRPLVVEMPYYRAGSGGLINQLFAPDLRAPELTLWLDDEQRALKRRMYEAHASQADVLARFPISVERFRIAPPHDFEALPNGADLHYEGRDWGLTGERWLTLVAEAHAVLTESAS